MAELTAQALKIGGRYNWKNQPERLVYIGMCEPRNGRWHQFEKVDEPGVVWCEVIGADLHMLEETPITSVAEFCAEGKRLGLTAADLAEALRKRPEFADCLPADGVPPCADTLAGCAPDCHEGNRCRSPGVTEVPRG